MNHDVFAGTPRMMALTLALLPSTTALGNLGAEQQFRDSLLRIELVEPAYRASIFSSQPEKRIVVRLVRWAELLEKAPVTVTLRDADGRELAEQVLEQQGQTALFEAAALAPGRYEVRATVPGPGGGVIEQTVAVQVRPPAPDEVMFDAEGICYLNGTPFFPRGLYHIDDFLEMVNEDNASAGEAAVTKEQMFHRVAAQGFNTAVTWTMWDRSFLDLGEKHRMRVIQCADLGGDPFSEWVQQIRDQPALLAVAILDEPYQENHFREGERRFRLAQELDPYHPVQVTECYSDLYATAATICDLLCIDPYPLNRNEWWRDMPWWNEQWTSSLRLVTKYADQTRELLGPHRPFWYVLQAFGDAGNWHVPTPEQLRNQTYQAIVAGARGLLFYAYISGEKTADGRHWWIEKSPVLWEACGDLNAELQALEPVLLAPGGQRLSCPAAPDLKILARKQAGHLFVFAVNIGETAQTLQLELPGPWKQATVWGEQRQLPVADGPLEDAFAPFAARVYELE